MSSVTVIIIPSVFLQMKDDGGLSMPKQSQKTRSASEDGFRFLDCFGIEPPTPSLNPPPNLRADLKRTDFHFGGKLIGKLRLLAK